MNGRLAGERWNRLFKMSLVRLQETRDMLEGEVMVSGYPAFHRPRTPREEYDELVAMRQANDPAFFTDPQAQADLAKLSMRFGPPPPQIAEPYGGVYA